MCINVSVLSQVPQAVARRHSPARIVSDAGAAAVSQRPAQLPAAPAAHQPAGTNDVLLSCAHQAVICVLTHEDLASLACCSNVIAAMSGWPTAGVGHSQPGAGDSDRTALGRQQPASPRFGPAATGPAVTCKRPHGSSSQHAGAHRLLYHTAGLELLLCTLRPEYPARCATTTHRHHPGKACNVTCSRWPPQRLNPCSNACRRSCRLVPAARRSCTCTRRGRMR